MTGLVDNIYGIAIIIHAVILLVREKTAYRRRDYITQIVFIVLCTAGGMADAIISGTPIMPLAITLAFVYLFANLLEGQIYNDALTGLNNRRRADEYVSEAIAAANEDNPLYLFVLDVDNFKSINDSLGHLEGDRALKAVARGVANTTEDFHGFAARWGGDEFVLAANSGESDLPERVCERLKENIAREGEKDKIPFPLAASVGFAKCTSPGDKMADLILVADKMLYKNKRNLEQPAA
ncbi:MAG: GGDEF domain-containing protein [Eggerthellaceae bacterium]|nr:GGDEF domain-containing protein [Eggerthellaceae bacterium]